MSQMKFRAYERIGRDVTVETADRGCLKKARYASKTIARDCAVKLSKKSGDPLAMRPYRCGLCGGWHLTGAEPRGLSQRPTEAIGRGKFAAPQIGKKERA